MPSNFVQLSKTAIGRDQGKKLERERQKDQVNPHPK
uniref:Uncharacterized protein n=1 Tax=Rhizophora mucronata TaxID=61149 RepID=A0A2P2QXP0_RHIMU